MVGGNPLFAAVERNYLGGKSLKEHFHGFIAFLAADSDEPQLTIESRPRDGYQVDSVIREPNSLMCS